MAASETQEQLHFALQTFTEVNRIITSSHNSDETLARTVRMIAKRIDVDACSIYIFDADRGVLILKATHGLDSSTVESVHMPPSEGLVGLVLERSAPVQVSKMNEHPRFKAFPQTKEESFSSFLGVPLIEHRKSFGVLVVHTTEPRVFSPEEVQILSSIATQKHYSSNNWILQHNNLLLLKKKRKPLFVCQDNRLLLELPLGKQ